uniref:CCHC-type domain-containing protein n=1 Tax=Arundo donax TaxID=35708 RepID=A0A0A8Z2J1_ARUDO
MLGKKGYNYDPKKNKFFKGNLNNPFKRKCYNYGDHGHISYDCLYPDKREVQVQEE